MGFGGLHFFVKQKRGWSKDATNGHVEAIKTLAACYSIGGCGFKEDDSEALRWYLMAAEADDKDAQYKVYHQYKYGVGTEKDETKSDYWWKRYASNETSVSMKFDLSRPLLH